MKKSDQFPEINIPKLPTLKPLINILLKKERGKK